MKSPQRRQHLAGQDRQEQIIDRAVELFAQKGFALTTRELASGLQITQPLLYRYFPSKQMLIEKVYERVFFSRWRPEWAQWLADRRQPFRQRLIHYLTDYTQAILHNEWVRIFLYAGLQDPALNQRYLAMLHKDVFSVINAELRHENHADAPPDARQIMLETEILWGFHASFFYMGVRKWVYQLPMPDDLEALIAERVDAFLGGVLHPARP
ncbi:MAG: TetR/AcrR family transcriptional regulator [Candidatus Dactylopiibacterium sp.]|nr:TetR/AcrR family transcriptional regulator [Candidatus Dactylopiibacterium sp.]